MRIKSGSGSGLRIVGLDEQLALNKNFNKLILYSTYLTENLGGERIDCGKKNICFGQNDWL